MNIINPYRFGAAAAFDGFGNASRDYVQANSEDITVPDSSSFPTGSQTWSCWVKVDNTSGIKTFVAKNVDTGNQRGGRIRLNNAKVQVYISADGSTPWTTVFSNSSLSANTWYHLAMVFSPSTHLKIYIDGVEDASNTTSIPSQIYDNTAPFCIGSLDNTLQYQDGKIADVRIYNADIGATAIADLASGTDYQTNLVGWWLTDTDDAVTDFAGTFADGTNNGSTYDADGPAD